MCWCSCSLHYLSSSTADLKSKGTFDLFSLPKSPFFDELHILRSVSVVEGVIDDWLAELDLSLVNLSLAGDVVDS